MKKRRFFNKTNDSFSIKYSIFFENAIPIFHFLTFCKNIHLFQNSTVHIVQRSYSFLSLSNKKSRLKLTSGTGLVRIKSISFSTLLPQLFNVLVSFFRCSSQSIVFMVIGKDGNIEKPFLKYRIGTRHMLIHGNCHINLIVMCVKPAVLYP